MITTVNTTVVVGFQVFQILNINNQFLFNFKAIIWGKIDVIAALINAGADVNKADNQGNFPLIWGTKKHNFYFCLKLYLNY